MVDVGNMKRFVFRRDVEPGRGGRVTVIPYDATGAQLTTDGGYVRGTGNAGISHFTNSGGSYVTGADSDSDFFFSLASSVRYIWVGYFGGTQSARVRSFSLESVDGGSLSVFQGLVDASSDPFPNDYAQYAIAAPATSATGISYPAGKRLTRFNGTGPSPSPGWYCTSQGNPGTWKAEAAVS